MAQGSAKSDPASDISVISFHSPNDLKTVEKPVTFEEAISQIGQKKTPQEIKVFQIQLS